MKRFDPLRQARMLGGESMPDAEAEAVKSLFTDWFGEFMRLRGEAERKYREKNGLGEPTPEQVADVLKHKAKPSDFPKVCFTYPNDIYGKDRNIFLEKIQLLYGDGKRHEDESDGSWRIVRRDVRDGTEDDEYDGLTVRERHRLKKWTAAQFRASRGRRSGEPDPESGDGIPVFRRDRYNPSLRKVNQQMHSRLSGTRTGGKRI